jgi:hypothetical protein
MENKILDAAINALKKNIALNVEIETEAVEQRKTTNRILRIKVDGVELHYYAEVKVNIPNITLAGVVIYKLKQAELPHDVLLVTRYVTAQLADQLKQENIQFIDTAGNAYINQLPLYIYVKGNKIPEAFLPIPHKRAFKPTGLKLIYALLTWKGLENKPYRDIAVAAEVALGTVVWQMNELKELGFILDMGKRGKKLVNRENLFNRWITAYPEQLKPKLIIGHYKGTQGWWQNKTLDPVIAQWGGEIAAAKMTRYLQPEIITLYVNRAQLNNLLLENRLSKDPEGETEILERFWRHDQPWQYEDMVHPILVYADLIATGNQRNIEIAKTIYDQYIVQFIRED